MMADINVCMPERECMCDCVHAPGDIAKLGSRTLAEGFVLPSEHVLLSFFPGLNKNSLCYPRNLVVCGMLNLDVALSSSLAT